MPQCIEQREWTTASHRHQLWLPAFLLVQDIHAVGTLNRDDATHELFPDIDTVHAAINLITDVPFRLLGNPDISPFYDEIHISWTNRDKQVVLMFFPNRAPLIHHYLRVPNGDSVHGIQGASAASVSDRLRWLRA